MSTTTATKAAVVGTKRKSAPTKVSQNVGSKKPKFEKTSKQPSARSQRSKPFKTRQTKSQTKSQTKAAKLSAEAPEPESDSDGGVLLENDESDSEEPPQNSKGVHPDRLKAVANNSQSSREAHAKQKQLAQERKAAKPLADSLIQTKRIWERLRLRTNIPIEERKQLIEELFGIITGRIKDFVLKHDSVRVIQTAIKYGNKEQRRIIARELSGTYRQLAESKYAKFLIGKLLVLGDTEIRDLIIPEFYGHVRRLIKHPEASWILDDIYRGVATKQQKSIILREWYGPEFSLFQKDGKENVTSDLSEILKEDASKRNTIMQPLRELINHLIQKRTTGFTLLHDAMLQYYLNTKPGSEEATEFLEIIKGDEEGDLLKNMAFTKSGSRLVCLALANGTAKDRKYLLKAYKDTLQLMVSDPKAHTVILTAYEVIDDTVLTAKSIFPELLSKNEGKQVENIAVYANDLVARTTLLYLFSGRSKSLFPAQISSDLELLAEIDTIRTTTSKKDPELRRQELANALSPYLLKAIASGATQLITTSLGCKFIAEVLFHAEGDKSAALNAIAEVAAGDPNDNPATEDNAYEGDAEAEEIPTLSHIANNPHGGRMLKALVAGGRFDAKAKKVVPVEPPLNFADILYPRIKDHIIEWATGSSSFVVLSMLECDSFSKRDELISILKKNKSELQAAAKGETAKQKGGHIARDTDEASSSARKRKSLKALAQEKKAGNKGSAMLLEIIS
ncbi:armadillo-type protein [Xylogone sp. PMI_703]|nr:armadillo-type protein [Xylogone sp. PMI_703]